MTKAEKAVQSAMKRIATEPPAPRRRRLRTNAEGSVKQSIER